MKLRAYLLFIVFFSFLEVTSGQLADGSLAPDFDAVDIYGNTYNLYSLLDQGKSVVVEFFVATDAEWAWAFHQDHVLNNLWTEYGPGGSDELFVFMIEIDESTGVDCLYGEGDCNSINWIEGTDFPVINNADIGYDYEIVYWPTVYYICPSKRLYQTGTAPEEEIYAYLTECPEPSGLDIGELISYSENVQDFCESLAISPSTFFQNMGTNIINNAVFELTINDIFVDSIYWSGSLGTYETTVVQFPEWTIYASSVVKIKLLKVNGITNTGNQYSEVFAYYDAPVTNQDNLWVKLKTDIFGSEIYWEVRDVWGTVYASGGNELIGPDGGGQQTGLVGDGAYYGDTFYTIPVTLSTEDCLEFLIVDDYGDGMCCAWGEGYYKIEDEDGNVILEGGRFQAEEIRHFEIAFATSVEKIIGKEVLSVFPNPVTDRALVSLEVEQFGKWMVLVTDGMGRSVLNSSVFLTPTENSFEIDFSDYASGVYFLTVFNEANIYSGKIVK